MSTRKANLNTSAYVQVNVGNYPMLIEAPGDAVRLAFNETQPAKSNEVFHVIGGTHSPTREIPWQDTNVWALATTDNSHLIATEFDGRPAEPHQLTADAWGRSKAVSDYSMFRALFSYDVPNRVWEEFSVDVGLNYTPLTSTGTLATSVLGSLQVSSGTTTDAGCTLLSRRHPRYQPNRGHLYSTAGWFPAPEADGTRKWGLMCGCLSETRRSGVYFELEGDGTDYSLYAVVRSYGNYKARVDVTASIPDGVDLGKNNLYDIQYQWRGAGDYMFYINQQLIHRIEFVNTQADLTLWNPALSVGFECFTHTTTELEMRFGCADVSSEGGTTDSRQFASVSTGETLLNADSTGAAMLGIRLPRTRIYNGVEVVNTRDLVASKISSWTRDEAAVQVWAARDTVATNLNGLVWDALPDSTANSLIGGVGSALDTAFQLDKGSMQLILNEWDDLEQKNAVINPAEGAAPFYITAGDILIVAVKTIAGTDQNATTIYLSEEL